MIGKIHEFVQEVWLPHLCSQGAELLVGGEGAATRGLPQLPLLKDLAVSRQLHSPLLGPPCTGTDMSSSLMPLIYTSIPEMRPRWSEIGVHSFCYKGLVYTLQGAHKGAEELGAAILIT